ncbi:MAG: asparagine synthase (glutamine-hydrolyzing) [Thiotrichales bacterium]
MCGIVGALTPHAPTPDLSAALCSLRHRGPDDSGTWRDAARGVVLGHTRLAVVELSPMGAQPMTSACGRHVICFNGEIYNHLELRAELGDVIAWRGHSDTETLLACIAHWGVDATLSRLVGMFAFALWDRGDATLTLARDRFGEKPLYYGWIGGGFAFASELRALATLPGFGTDIDRDAVARFLRHGYIPTPHCIYHGSAKLLPGSYLRVSATDLDRHRLPEPTRWWSAFSVAESGVREPLPAEDENGASSELEIRLRESVRGQMLADVPLGAFLSGGVDSSTIVALMQAQSMLPVKTFTIGFEDPGYDEAEHANAVARHLGTAHTEWYVTPGDARAVIPGMGSVYSEPFADSSQIPTLLVSRLTRQHVTVALSGDGGDELFGGYTRYFLAADLWHGVERVPRPLRAGLAALALRIPARRWDALYAGVRGALPSRLQMRAPGSKLHKAANVMLAADGAELYEQLIAEPQTQAAVLGAGSPPGVIARHWPTALPSLIERMMAADTTSYLPDDILVKVDRAAMSASLETRVPLLDHRLFEFAWRLPLSLKVRGGQGKWLLRQVLYRYVPSSLIERPKMGFAIPVGVWLRDPLRDWAEALLDESRLRREGIFAPGIVRGWWKAHLAGEDGFDARLWYVLMFQEWIEHNSAANSTRLCA